MKLPLNWLKDYIDPKLSTEKLVERLTMAGLEVETVESVGSDTVLEIEITPNRPDCLSLLGLAREVGAITAKAVKYPKIKTFKTSLLKNAVHIEDKKDCRRYIATLIKDVQIQDAPAAMKERLASVGINSINNAVDVTNFVLMETGQPLHAFDYDKLAGGKVIVRRARAGEAIITLDGLERKLDPSILIIADAEKPVAIAGIMGGKGSEITSQTKNILLESAHFELGIVRRASRALGLRSDSSYRFERNVNVDGVLTGADRATGLLLELAAGRLAGRQEVSSKSKTASRTIKLKVAEIEDLLGHPVTASQAKRALVRLGFNVTAQGAALTVVSPSTRLDVNQAVDVIEEIARIIGFDHLSSKMPTIKSQNITVDQRPRQVKEKIRQALTAGGVDEIITLSMVNQKAMVKTNLANLASVRVLNPLSQDQELLRASMVPSMLQAVVTNINHGQKDLRFFEIGKRYFADAEKESLGIVLVGRRAHDWRLPNKDTVDIFDLKGLLERIFANIGIRPIYAANQFPVLDPDCAAALTLDGKYLGALGKIERKILQNWDIKHQDVYYAGLHLDEIFSLPSHQVRYQAIGEFPGITRDVSLGVKKDIPYQKIEDICLQHADNILKQVQFIEQYSGDKIQPGLKALVFSCIYQSNTRTLREDEVSRVHERILKALTSELDAVLR